MRSSLVDTGTAQRMKILREHAESSILSHLRNHGWISKVERESIPGEYLIISAARGTHTHKIALLYTSATDNAVYKALSQEVEQIFTKGELYHIESYAYGISTPVTDSGEFFTLLYDWNAAASEGKFACLTTLADDDDSVEESANSPRLLLSENPIEAIWLRLRQFHSVTLATKIIAERAERDGVSHSPDELQLKAEGTAFSLRNATEYFTSDRNQNVNQRILNLYYGSMAFAQAEMLPAPNGPRNLAEIESATKQGHGLYTIDGEASSLSSLVVGVIRSGFFADWQRFLGVDLQAFPVKKPRNYNDIPALPMKSWITFEELFARVPETGDLFSDIFDSPARWVQPSYDQFANRPTSFFSSATQSPLKKSYIKLIDASGRLKLKDVTEFPGPITEIQPLNSSGSAAVYRVAIDHPLHDHWFGALSLHHSPFVQSALIMPAFAGVTQYRCLCVVILYALSIIVRYRPSLWRRVQEGDLDHMRVLIDAFLAVVERVLPQHFLEQISGQRVFAKQPGSFL